MVTDPPTLDRRECRGAPPAVARVAEGSRRSTPAVAGRPAEEHRRPSVSSASRSRWRSAVGRPDPMVSAACRLRRAADCRIRIQVRPDRHELAAGGRPGRRLGGCRFSRRARRHCHGDNNERDADVPARDARRTVSSDDTGCRVPRGSEPRGGRFLHQSRCREGQRRSARLRRAVRWALVDDQDLVDLLVEFSVDGKPGMSCSSLSSWIGFEDGGDTPSHCEAGHVFGRRTTRLKASSTCSSRSTGPPSPRSRGSRRRPRGSPRQASSAR